MIKCKIKLFYSSLCKNLQTIAIYYDTISPDLNSSSSSVKINILEVCNGK